MICLKGTLLGLRQFLVTESLLIITKNAFYFTLKALFFLKIFKFILDFLVIKKYGLIRKRRLISKLMTSQTGKQTIAICILRDISRSKNNQTMKFDKFIKYNVRNIFLEKSYIKCGGNTIPRCFSKKSKLSISMDNSLKFYTVCFY